MYNEMMKHPELWTQLPKFEMSGEEFKPKETAQPGISLVSCCMNRNDHLVQAIPSWLAHKEISELVIVDWSSECPVEISLNEAGIHDPRIRVIRVEDEGAWVLSHAYNLGFRATTHDTIIKIDSDVILDPSFFQKNSILDGHFIAGNWRRAKKGQGHVNGFFLVGRKELLSVNGFNERIVSYGWDDDDLYQRLTEAGVRRSDVDPDTIHHIDHTDIRRVERFNGRPATGWDEVQSLPRFWINLNKILESSSAPWDITCPMTDFQLLSKSDGVLRLRRRSPFGVDTSLIGTRYERAEAAVAAIHQVFDGVVITAPCETLDYALLTRPLKDAIMVTGKMSLQPDEGDQISVPLAHTARKPRLVIDAQHGLGNRLRAITSAYAFSTVHDRELVIRWVRDEHCDCSFESLFQFDGEVESDSSSNSENALTLDLMNKAFRDSFSPDTLARTSRDVIIQSAYKFTHGQPYHKIEREFLHTLKPSVDVQSLIDSVRSPNDVSAHIRMNGGASTDPHGDVAGDWSKIEDEIARRARSRSHYGYFFKRLDELLGNSEKSTIFLASDNSETYDAFSSKYGDRVAFLSRAVFDRSEEQLKYALADMILLSRAPILLGSSWSSFTEVAHSLARNQRLEMSGKHF